MIEALGIDLKELLFAIANFLILMTVLTKFLYRPFLNMLDKRKQSIQDAFDNAEAVNRRADEKMNNYNARIANVEAEAREIIKDAKVKADRQAGAIISEAENRASEMIIQARAEIERDRSLAMEEARDQIAMIAIMAAEKIIEKELDGEAQTQIIDNILEEAGASGWQN
ncbi:MAG: F0F1 ATP synthase subunit B [Firmicutes bacterium]|nr:F0F1 ATP synthase subunit B [Bacillota bacterium]